MADGLEALACALQPFGITAEDLKHKLGFEFNHADYARHLQLGDEVAVNRTKRVVRADGTVHEQPLVHWHYGIYIGDGYVVDFGAENDTDVATIARRTWGTFCGSTRDYAIIRTIRVDWPPTIRRKPEESMQEALHIADMEATERRATYNPHNNNCQHLATWCCIGYGDAGVVAPLHALLPAVWSIMPPMKHQFSSCLI